MPSKTVTLENELSALRHEVAELSQLADALLQLVGGRTPPPPARPSGPGTVVDMLDYLRDRVAGG